MLVGYDSGDGLRETWIEVESKVVRMGGGRY